MTVHQMHRAQAPAREVVSASWRRSLDAQVDPERSDAPTVYERAEMAEVRGAHPLAAALPLLRETLVSIADEATHMMVVTDAHGHVLWREGQRDVLRGAERINLVEGTRWTEESIGTNAMGTALATGRAVQIHSTEHLVHSFHPWTCAAAPVRSASGEVIGSVDVTGPARTFHPATLALVTAAARLAENFLAGAQAPRRAPPRGQGPPTLGLAFLGTNSPTVHRDGRPVPITPRHAELLALLALHPEGLSADELTTHLRGEAGKSVTVRAEVHRLRSVLPDLVRTAPYRLHARVSADFLDVAAALAEGRVRAAALAYRGPLLPHSEAPGVRAARDVLTGTLRRAVLASADPEAMWAFAETVDGADDIEVSERLLRVLAARDPRRPLLGARRAVMI